ncbi:DUF4132 domain-containing protein [Methylobacterium aquaticum]|uniref:DUF4132 domain-containing protein n=1 Tax=Methylobacterium aquaticum TaxID=270351 RepID=UPI003D18081B
MQRYELTAGSSSKFWEAGTEGNVLTVRFGRLGTQGQSKARSFSDPAAARAELDRLVREKTGKGYTPAGAPNGAATPLSAAPDVARPDVAEAPPTVPIRKTPRVEEARAALFSTPPLPTRTRPGAPLDPAADWAAFTDLIRPLLGSAPEAARSQANALAARLDREPPSPDAGLARDWLETLQAACPAMDQRGWGERPGPQGPAARAAFAHFARWLVGRAGTKALVAVYDRLRPRPEGAYAIMPASVWDIPTTVGVRAALTAAPEADYQAALAAGLRLIAAEPDPHLGLWLAHVLADDRPEANHDLRPGVMLDRHGTPDRDYGHSHAAVPLILDLPPSQAASWRAKPCHRASLATCDVTTAEAAATAIAVARAAGEPATASLVWLLDGAVGADRTTVAKALLETRADDALAALVPFTGAKLVRDALDAGDAAFPDWMLRAYLAALDGKGEPAYAPRIVVLAGRHGVETARAWAAGGAPKLAGRLDRLLADNDRPQAPREAWPPLLRDPPWRRKATARARLERTLAPIPTPFAHGFDAVTALDTERYSYRSGHVVAGMDDLAAAIRATEGAAYDDRLLPVPAEPVPDADTTPDMALAWLGRRLQAGLPAFSYFYFHYGPWIKAVCWQPEPLALLLWERTDLLRAANAYWFEAIPGMVARFGETALPGLAAAVAAQPAELLPLVTGVDAAGLAPVVARAFLRIKTARPVAVAWLRAHPATAAMRLLPDALGPAGPERDAADAALRFLAAEQAGRAALDAALAAYAGRDPRVKEAAASGVDGDPLDQVPGKPPKLPAWLVPAALPRPVLEVGGALPDEAVALLCEMLAFSDPLVPYAGIAPVRAACTPDSLDAFASALFEAWIAAGAPAAGEWAMRASALLGGDACARTLTRQIRAWGQAGLKPRAKAGIAVLAGIGTDVALMNLAAIAEKNPALQLREAAGAAIADAAEARGLDEADLADRLSPDLGLDARGGLDLDFGARRFRVGFDETLKPVLRDAEGRPLPALPRPARTDDPDAAKAAGKLWAGLKKDAEAVARLQITRLETMLAHQRRIAPAVFQPFFAAHPLIRHLAGRLVWGLYPDGAPTSRPRLVFRLAEDLSATDAEDAGLDLDGAEGVVGLVHPLHLEPEALAAWSALFADYEIAQPFPQLARETYAFTEAERARTETDRFDGARVAGRRLRGLRAQGWTTDASSEHVHDVRRRVALPGGAGLTAVLRFEDGFWHSPGRDGDGVQTLRSLSLTEDGWRASPRHRLGDLDPVTASEVLRAPSLLAASGAD